MEKKEKGRTKTRALGLVVKSDPGVLKKADGLERWLIARGCRVVRKTSEPPNCQRPSCRQELAPPDLDCVVVLGGDGTFLSAARWLGDQQAPLLGIKFGQVGFLAEASEEHLYNAVESILDKPFATLPRMRLRADVWRLDQKVASEVVLNDVVINRGALARLAHIKTYVNDGFLTDYRADGLIVATPTGSTAYSLAAGGPIIYPTVQGILMTPICPFTLTNRPLIVPDDAVIKIQLAEKTADIIMTFDGQVGIPINEQNTIVVRRDPLPVNTIVLPDRDFFDVLKAKLRWSGSRV
ncbi:MAG: NAD(+)/NADH kinase [Desulfobacteraceae bacterium]|jgi:NAD+ kinase